MEREEPSEQPCREGETIPPFRPPNVPPSNVNPIGLTLLDTTGFNANLNVIVTSAPPRSCGALIFDNGILQDYTSPFQAFMEIPPGIRVTISSLWVKFNEAPMTNDVPVQLVKNGVPVGPTLFFPIGTSNLIQHTAENVVFEPGDTIYYSGGDQLFDFIYSSVTMEYCAEVVETPG